MPRSYAQNYERKRKFLSKHVEEGNVAPEDADAIRELVNAFDEARPTTTKPNWPDAQSNITKYRSKSTLTNWLYYLTTYGRELTLLEATAQDLNRLAEQWLRGDSDLVKDEGLSKGTIRAYQNSARLFYRYHEDLGVDFADIAVFDANETAVDPRDMLDPEEIEAVRAAPESPRDKAIVDMLLYTGIRNNGLRTLRVKDVDVQDSEWYFNDSAEHLKDIYQPRAPRPLLGAENAIREWLSYHPYSDDPDAYLVTAKPKWNTVDPHEPVSDRTIARVMDSIKATAEVDKPLHPHACRHNFVTLCKRDYDLDDSTVKFLIGHNPDSTVMETTYAHLSGEDHVSKARVASGKEEPDDNSPLTPNFCNRCDEPLEDHYKMCPACGKGYTPDAKDASETIKDSSFGDMKRAETPEQQDAVEAFREAVKQNPELKAFLVSEMTDD